MNRLKVFTYSRGSEYTCDIVMNEFAGSCCPRNIKVPNNTPQQVKQAFLDEAEAAAYKQLEDGDLNKWTRDY